MYNADHNHIQLSMYFCFKFLNNELILRGMVVWYHRLADSNDIALPKAVFFYLSQFS